MRRNSGIYLASLAAALFSGESQRYHPLDFTLDEEEEQSAQRMLLRHRHKVRMAERRLQQQHEAELRAVAEAKEAARPKSRQELRAMERSLPTYGDKSTKSRPRSDSLERLIGKRQFRYRRR